MWIKFGRFHDNLNFVQTTEVDGDSIVLKLGASGCTKIWLTYSSRELATFANNRLTFAIMNNWNAVDLSEPVLKKVMEENFNQNTQAL